MAQCFWGVFPLYLKLLAPPTEAVEIVGHRVVWSFVLLTLLVLISSLFRVPGLPRWKDIRSVFANTKTLVSLFFAALLILGNWLGFVAAIAMDRTMDVSVGYYICPQVVVLLGVIFQKENFSRGQWFAFACTSLGVLAMAVSTSGIPWLGLLVAFSFGFYALFKKRIDCSALTSLTFETGILFLPAAGFLIYRTAFGPSAALPVSDAVVSAPVLNLLLVLLGVATVVPLAMYVDSVKRLPLSMAGLLQFVGPTIQFGLSIFVFGDTFDWPRVVGILLIWTGVVLYLRAMRSKASV